MITITATFTADVIKKPLECMLAEIGIDACISFTPYNQVFQQLLDKNSQIWKNRGIANVILLRLEDWASSCNRDTCKSIEDNVNYFISAILALADKAPAPTIICICPPSATIQANQKMRACIYNMENKLSSHLGDLANVYLLSSSEVNQNYPVKSYYDEHAEKEGHIPYTQEFFCALSLITTRQIFLTIHAPYKVIVLDCDNTLWRGICGEAGVDDLIISSDYTYLQKFMLNQYNAGKLLCLCSKNVENDVWKIFDQHPNMILQRQHLTSWRINWEPKSQNMAKLAKELNLGLDSFIFIDDNPLECAEMRATHPEVLTIQIPNCENEIPELLNHMWAFDYHHITAEDKKRTKLYKQNIMRENFKEQTSTLKDFINGLNLNIGISKINQKQVTRAAQLTQRTNQFNFTTKRYSDSLLQDCLKHNKECLITKVKDRFGDYGVVGVIIFQDSKNCLEIDTFLLSCRVLGKGVEHKMLSQLGKIACHRNKTSVKIPFHTTDKNKPALNFIESLTITNKVDIEKGYIFTLAATTAKALTYNPTEKNNTIQKKQKPKTRVSEAQNIALTKIAKEYRKPKQLLNALERDITERQKPKNYKLPQSETEKQLVELWQNCLKLRPIGISDNFFTLGGSSLQVALLVSKICKTFSISMSISDFIVSHTLYKLAIKIQELQKNDDKLRNIAPIPEEQRQKPLPLSWAQQRLWFIEQINPNSSLYNMFTAISLYGNLNIFALEYAFNTLITRHECLRTYFITVKGEPQQVILPPTPKIFSLHIENISGLPESALYKRVRAEAQKPFDLTKAPLVRVKLLKQNDSEYILLICLHHVINDGTSFNILCNELNEIYESFVLERKSSLEKPAIQYSDFSAWERKRENSQLYTKQMTYWTNKLANLEPLNTPTDYTRSAQNEHHGKRIKFTIDATLTKKLKQLSSKAQTTLFTTLLAAFDLLLAYYSGQEDISISTPIAGRYHPALQNMVGFFVNILILRNDLSGNPTFLKLLKRCHQTTSEAYINQDLPFDKIVEALRPARDSRSNPLSQIAFVYQNFPVYPIKLKGVKAKRIYADNDSMLLADYDSSKLDLTLYMQEVDNTLHGLFEFNTSLFKISTIERFTKCFSLLLNKVTAHPEKNISQIDYIPPDEKQLLNKFQNINSSNYPTTATLQQLFELQAYRSPNKIAVRHNNKIITYKNLNKKANQLARYLLRQGLTRETLVAICVERNIDMIIGILGILKAGGVYAPIDPNYPTKRIDYLLANMRSPILLTQQNIIGKIRTSITNTVNNMKLLKFDNLWQILEHENGDNLTSNGNSSSLAYIVYTSGSTGKPKGVALEHRTIINLVNWQSEQIKIKSTYKIAQFSTFGFDVSVQEIFNTLLNGHELCIVNDNIKSDMRKFLEFIQTEKITQIFIPTIVLDFLAQAALEINPNLCELHNIAVAGEALKITAQIKHFFALYQHITLTNQYGPSEAHVVTSYNMPKNALSWPEFPSIGAPIANTQIHILNKNMQHVPIGVPGEIYIGGAGLAREYWGKPDQTNEKFIANPYKKSSNEKLYRTGDLARWLPDGNIEYIERIDDQVKIRGYRIELGEIETTLSSYQTIQQAVVIAQKNSEKAPYLTAFIILNKNTNSINLSFLKRFLKQKLPDYMIPANFITLDAFPLSSNGKIDKKALAGLELIKKPDNLKLTFPRDPVQKQLTEIFTAALHINPKKLSIHDNFFDLGGHSLLAIKLISAIKNSFKVDIKVKSLFDAPSIAELSHIINNSIINESRRALKEEPTISRNELIN